MTIHKIFAEDTVSVTEMRKSPASFFTDRPVAVLSNNQAVGYLVGAELFESMMELIRQVQPQETFAARFQPNVKQLKEAAAASAKFLATAKDEDLADFVE